MYQKAAELLRRQELMFAKDKNVEYLLILILITDIGEFIIKIAKKSLSTGVFP